MPIKSDLNFVAQWWPIVTFNANGGDWELMEDRATERYVPVPANSDHIDALRPPQGKATPSLDGMTVQKILPENPLILEPEPSRVRQPFMHTGQEMPPSPSKS
ncbi:MAG: hypothetical protein V8Q32_07690 [Anaerotignum faecicola]